MTLSTGVRVVICVKTFNVRAILPVIMVAVALFAGCGETRASRDEGRVGGGLEGAFEGPGAAGRTARSELPEAPGLSDCLAFAALENPGLEAAFYRWQARVDESRVRGSLPDPRFSYTWYIEEVETRVGPQRQSFAISQMFPWFGKLALERKESEYAARAAWARFQMEKFALFHRVEEAWWDYYYLARAAESVKDNLDLVKQLEAVIRTAYETDNAGYSDLIRTQVEIGRLEDRLESLIDKRRPAVARLNAAMNRPVEAALAWPALVDQGPDAMLDEARVLALMRESNPELDAMANEVAAGEAAIEGAGRDFYPDLTALVTYIDTGGAVMSGVSDSGKDPVLATIAINVPLNRSKYRAAESAARGRHRAAAMALEERRNDLGRLIQSALYEYRDARRRAALYGETLLPQARQAFQAAETAFRGGDAGFADLIDAQRVLLEFELSRHRSFADAYKSLARLQMLAGGDLTPPRHGAAAWEYDTTSDRGEKR